MSDFNSIVLNESLTADAPKPLVQTFSWASLENPFVPEVVGTVESREEFSRTIPRDDGQDFIEDFIYIKAPVYQGATAFHIPEKYRQLVPVIETAIRHHYANNERTAFDYCTRAVMQATSKIVVGDELHIDINNQVSSMHNQAGNSHSYITYDKAPAMFHVQPFTVDLSIVDPDDWKAGGDELAAQFAHQARPELIRRFAPFSIVHFDSTDVHHGQAVPNMGPRTAFVVEFPPKIDGVSPERIRNPALLHAMGAAASLPKPQPVIRG